VTRRLADWFTITLRNGDVERVLFVHGRVAASTSDIVEVGVKFDAVVRLCAWNEWKLTFIDE